MTNEDIILLVKAGYTKNDIEAMTQKPEETAAPAAQPEETAAPAEPAANPEESAETQAAPASAPAGDASAAILKALERLSNQIITGNINHDTQPQTNARSAADALAEIIAPPAAHRNNLGGK